MKISKLIKHGVVRWRVAFVQSGREVRRFFPTRGAAEAFGGQVRHEQESLGSVWLAADARQRNQMVESWLRAERRGYTLAQACDAYEATQARPPARTLGELHREFLEAKRQQGLRPRSLEGLAHSLGGFVRGRELVAIDSLTPADIAAHLAREGWSQSTRRTVLVDLGTLFNWAVRMEWLARNPVARVPRPILEKTAKCVHTAEQVERILRTCERLDAELAVYGALGYFAGLRPESEIERLPVANIRDGHIRVDFTNKTRRSRDVTIRPNLAAWLARWRGTGWPVFPVDAHRRWQRVRLAAGFSGREQDVMRHTFASAHYVLHGEAETVREAGHSAAELHASYRALLTREQAAAIFAILPSPEPWSPRPLRPQSRLTSERARAMARLRHSSSAS